MAWNAHCLMYGHHTIEGIQEMSGHMVQYIFCRLMQHHNMVVIPSVKLNFTQAAMLFSTQNFAFLHKSVVFGVAHLL